MRVRATGSDSPLANREHGIGRRTASSQLSIEILHVPRSGAIADTPQRHHHPSSSRLQEGVGEANDPFASKLLTQRRLACRQRDEIGRQSKPANGIEVQAAVGHQKGSALRMLVIEERVRREVQIAIARRIQRQPVGDGCLITRDRVTAEQ